MEKEALAYSFIKNSFNDPRLQEKLEQHLELLKDRFFQGANEYELEKFYTTYADSLRMIDSAMQKELQNAVSTRQHELVHIIESQKQRIDAEFSRQYRNYNLFLSAAAASKEGE